jgi:hypothetical protein
MWCQAAAHSWSRTRGYVGARSVMTSTGMAPVLVLARWKNRREATTGPTWAVCARARGDRLALAGSNVRGGIALLPGLLAPG